MCDEARTAEEREALADATQGETMFTPLYWWNRKVRSAAWKRPAIEVRQLIRTRARVGALGHVVRGARQWQAELIHTNTILTPEGGRAAQLVGLGQVWHLRELIGRDKLFHLPLEGPALGRYLMAHAPVVVANSTVSAGAVSSLLAPGRLEVIPNGIDLAAFEGINRRPTGRVVAEWSRTSPRAGRSTCRSSKPPSAFRAPSFDGRAWLQILAPMPTRMRSVPGAPRQG